MKYIILAAAFLGGCINEVDDSAIRLAQSKCESHGGAKSHLINIKIFYNDVVCKDGSTFDNVKSLRSN